MIRLAFAYDAQLRRKQAQIKAERAAAGKARDECFGAAKGNPAKSNPFDCFDPDKVGTFPPQSK
jgi:hypothetical protein